MNVPATQVNRTLAFGVVSLVVFMAGVDGSIVSTGLPTISRALHARINWTSWTISGYEFGLVLAMPVAGSLSDRFGRSRVLLIAAVLFSASSLLCGLSTNIWILLVFRVLQALGGGAFIPSATGIVSDLYGEQRATAVGLFSSIFPIGFVVGPILGGLIISGWSWRGIFFLNVPLGIAFVLLGLRYLPQYSRGEGRVDALGALLIAGTVLGVMFGITELGNARSNLVSPTAIASFTLAVACGVVLVRHNSRTLLPILPTALLRESSFAAMNLINLLWGGCVIGFVSLIPLFAEDRFHFAPIKAGSLLIAQAVGEMALAAFAALTIRRTGYKMPIAVGLAMMAGGFVMIALAPRLISAYLWLLCGAAIIGLGTGISAPAANNAMLELLPEHAGAITGIRGASRQSGAIVVVALTTSIAARAHNHAAALDRSSVALAVLLMLIIPLVALVPNPRHAAHPHRSAR